MNALFFPARRYHFAAERSNQGKPRKGIHVLKIVQHRIAMRSDAAQTRGRRFGVPRGIGVFGLVLEGEFRL